MSAFGWTIGLIVGFILFNTIVSIISLQFNVGWANRLWNLMTEIYAIIISMISAPIISIFRQIIALFVNLYTEITEHKAYGLVLGAIIASAIILNYAAYDPAAGSTDIYKYLFPILAILGSVFSYMLISKLSGSTPNDYSVLVALALFGVMFGAAFYFYSSGLTYPLTVAVVCCIAYLFLSYISGTSMKYVIIALTSLAAIFGLSLYYIISIGEQNLHNSIIPYVLSSILTLSIVIGLAIVFYFYSNYLKTVGGWKGWLVNFIFYVPCLILDFLNYIKSEIGLTSHLVYYLFLIELIAALLYIYIPKIINQVAASEGTPLLADTAFLDIKKELGSGYTVAFKNTSMADDAVTTFKRSYSISMWVYLNIQAPNYASYAKEAEIFNYGNGLPKVTYVNNVDTDGDKTPDVLKIYYTNKGNVTEQSFTVNIKPQKWNQLVFNYTSSQVDLFINGHLEKTYAFNDDPVNPNLPEYLPSDVITVGSEDGLDGAICNVKYHYVPQTKSQIATSYNLLMKQNPPTNIL